MEPTLTPEELQDALTNLGMSSDAPEEYRALLEANLAVVSLIDQIEPPPTRRHERVWKWPKPEDNPLGAWYVKTNVQPSAEGVLSGKTVALKDTVLLADVPLMGGSKVLEGYVPDRDAEIVERMLNAGATITGKSVCEAYCFSGGSHTSDTGPVMNPHNHEHTSGGSSSGSGALVAAGEVDMAVGCDQGGSIRVPASYCGIVGLKPTHGLVPYTGILGMNPNIDHTGPMTRTVAENATLLAVIAGRDGVDSRQIDTQVGDYGSALESDVSGLRVGILAEGFGQEGGDPRVDEKVRVACDELSSLGVAVEEVSVPEHLLGAGVTFAGIQSMMISMFTLDGCIIERPDVTPEGYQLAHSRWRQRADDLPHNLKVGLLTAELMRSRYGYTYISRAMERLPAVRAAYDAALSAVDALVMPTTITTAPRLPSDLADPLAVTEAAFAPLRNTSPFNSTHHPALSIPCGMVDDLPVGMMLVGRHWDESTLYCLANAFEQSTDWRRA